MLRQLEQRTGVPGGFIESDLVDPRYFGKANIENRVQSYLQMLEARQAHGVTGTGAHGVAVKCVVGIDLGSTTTKAVLLDEEGAGRSAGGSPTAAATTRSPAPSRGPRRSPPRASTCSSARSPATRVRAGAARALTRGVPPRALPATSSAICARPSCATSSATSRTARERAALERRSTRGARRDRRAGAAALFLGGRAAQERLLPRHRRRRASWPRPRRSRARGRRLRAARRRSTIAPSSRWRPARRRATSARCSGARSIACSPPGDPQTERARARGSRRIERRCRASTSRRSPSSAPATGGRRCPFPKEAVRSEILCHGRGAHRVFPGTRTVLDIGGQDTKAIQVDEHGVVTSFQMNDRCAAGCGRYLGYIADELNLGLHELGPLALQAHQGGQGQLHVHGLRRRRAARAARARPAARGHPRRAAPRHHAARDVAAGALGRRRERVHLHRRRLQQRAWPSRCCASWSTRTTARTSTLNIHPDSIFMGALGAALFGARRRARGPRAAAARLRARAASAEATHDDRVERHGGHRLRLELDQGRGRRGAARAPTGEILGHARAAHPPAQRARRRRRRPSTRPAPPRRRRADATSTTSRAPATATPSTFATGHFYGMTTHARGALFLFPEARAALDMGALHARAIRMDERGKVLGHRMTSQCASGSGQFLENIARYLGVPLEDVGPLSHAGRSRRRRCRASARCSPRPTSSTWSAAA